MSAERGALVVAVARVCREREARRYALAVRRGLWAAAVVLAAVAALTVWVVA